MRCSVSTKNKLHIDRNTEFERINNTEGRLITEKLITKKK